MYAAPSVRNSNKIREHHPALKISRIIFTGISCLNIWMSQDVSSRFGASNVKTSVHLWLQVHFRRIPKKSTASTGGMSLTWAAQVPTELLVSYWWTVDDVDVWHLCFLDCNMLIYVDICWMFILLQGHCRYLLKFCWNAFRHGTAIFPSSSLLGMKGCRIYSLPSKATHFILAAPSWGQ